MWMQTSSLTRNPPLFAISPSCDQVDVFGIDSSQTNLLQKTFSDGTWSDWKRQGGLTFKSPPTAVIADPGTLDVFVTDTSNTLFTRHYNGSVWTPTDSWHPIGYGVTAVGSAISQWNGRIDVYTRRIANNETISFYNTERNSPRWVDLWYGGRIAKEPPVAIVTGTYTMDILVLGNDSRIWHNHDYWGRHSGFSSIGDQTFISNPSVVSISPGRLDIFAIASDKSAMHNSFQHMTSVSDGVWTGWERLNGGFGSSLTAVGMKETNTIYVFGLSSSGALWHRAGNGSVWPGNWQSHSGYFINTPSAVSSCRDTVDVFGLGSDMAVWHQRRGPAGVWTPGLGSWESLQGSLHVLSEKTTEPCD